MRYRWLVFALIVGALAFVAAGCGGGDDDGGSGRGQRGRHRRHLGHGDLGRRGAGVVPGRDRRLQRALPERQRQVHVGRRQPRAAALDRGRGRQPAGHRSDRSARADAELRRAGCDPADRRPPRHDRRQLRRVGGGRRRGRRHAVRRHVQGRQQVDHLVQRRRPSRRPASTRPRPGTTSRGRADTLKAAGITPYSVGVDVGWPITDLFENVYIRSAGPEMYDQLANHEIPWTDQSVKDALTIMADVVGDSDNMAGGTETVRCRPRCPTPSRRCSPTRPRPRWSIIGDFAPGVVETTLEPETGYNVFTFPSIDGSGPVGGRWRRPRS